MNKGNIKALELMMNFHVFADVFAQIEGNAT